MDEKILKSYEKWRKKAVLDSDLARELAEMARKLDVRLKEILNIKAEVRLALPKTLPRFEGKSKHVIDNRSYE